MLFAGLRFRLLSVGKGFPKKRRQILSDRISENGGSIVEGVSAQHLKEGSGKTQALFIVIDDAILDQKNWKLKVEEAIRADLAETVLDELVSRQLAKIVSPNLIQACIRKHDLDVLIEGVKLLSSEIASSEEIPRFFKEQAGSRKSTSSTHASVQSRCPKTYMEETLNDELEQELRQLSNLYGHIKNEQWRQKTYRVAADIVRRLPFAIKNITDLEKPELVRLGPRTKEKIREWLLNGEIQRKKLLAMDEKLAIIQLFSKIWGVGLEKAETLYCMGFRTLEDLRKNLDVLDRNQRIGLHFVEDFATDIPRAEIEAILAKIITYKNRLFPLEDIEVCPAGSYRRGADSCGDCDVLAFKTANAALNDELVRWVEHMKGDGFILQDLAYPHKTDEVSHCHTWYGVCRLTRDSKARRLDIKMYTAEVKSYALLHFTGCSFFNRAMRYHAKKLGFHLSDKGMWRCIRRGGHSIPAGPPIIAPTEEKIFDILGMKYIPPTERLTGDISGLILTNRPKRRRRLSG